MLEDLLPTTLAPQLAIGSTMFMTHQGCPSHNWAVLDALIRLDQEDLVPALVSLLAQLTVIKRTLPNEHHQYIFAMCCHLPLLDYINSHCCNHFS